MTTSNVLADPKAIASRRNGGKIQQQVRYNTKQDDRAEMWRASHGLKTMRKDK